MRLTYLDEAGVSPNQIALVVGGAIIDGDSQLEAIENHFSILLLKHIPHADRGDFVFHASDIWSGTGYFGNRERWPLERRLEILDDLVAIPAKFDVPVAYGAIDWTKITLDILRPERRTPAALEIAAHMVAFGHCCMGVEKFMRLTFPNENTILIAEDRDKVRAVLKSAIAAFRNPVAVRQLGLDSEYFPFRRIRDTVHFAKKSESRHLQIADTCTFVVRGHFMGRKHNDRFWNVLNPHLIWDPKMAPFAEISTPPPVS
jgi:hypothetical protein